VIFVYYIRFIFSVQRKQHCRLIDDRKISADLTFSLYTTVVLSGAASMPLSSSSLSLFTRHRTQCSGDNYVLWSIVCHACRWRQTLAASSYLRLNPLCHYMTHLLIGTLARAYFILFHLLCTVQLLQREWAWIDGQL